MERNIVSANVAEAEGELVGFRSIVAILSWSGRKGNVRSWRKSGNDGWGRNLGWKSRWCICWWFNDGDDWFGWVDCWGSYDLRRSEGRDVEAERIDGRNVDGWW